MIPVYAQPAALEALAKEKYAIPEFLMMENAAKTMADFIVNEAAATVAFPAPARAIIVCGKGNNGGDGYALARLLQNKLDIKVLCIEPPTAEEARAQYEMCRRLGILMLNATSGTELEEFQKLCAGLKPWDFLIDCIYGTGFHGELKPQIKKILGVMNKASGTKIACDISSGLNFHSDYTITMGSQKLALYSDKAKAVSGKIIVADLGIASEKFEDSDAAQAFLIEDSDLILPLRKNRAAHKGTYGHTAVFCGEKSGAAILAATAAMNFGSGLTSLLPATGSDLAQFKISPSLMISENIPAKASCLLLGPGFTGFPSAAAGAVLEWFKKTEKPATVFDAGILTAPEALDFLTALNQVENARIILTPHLSELARLLENCRTKKAGPDGPECPRNTDITSLAENPKVKISAGRFLTSLFPKSTIIMKSANTFIAAGDEVFIIADGAQSLAKGGSGDILAGLAASLLAQGYETKTAAITAAGYHASLSKRIGEEAFNLTPEKLLEMISFDACFNG